MEGKEVNEEEGEGKEGGRREKPGEDGQGALSPRREEIKRKRRRLRWRGEG